MYQPRQWPFLTIALASALTLSCSSQPRQNGDKAAGMGTQTPAGWSEKMQALSKTLSDLLPLVSSRSKFNDEKNQTRIQEDTKRLGALTHSLGTGTTPSSDPSLRMMTGLFEEDIQRAIESLNSGNREYARSILKDTTAYCIQCHTQTNNGPDFPRLNLDINTTELNPLERAEFYAATRQFDNALETYTEVLNSEALAKADPFAWEQAARTALAIVVRVKKDPKATRELIDRIEKNPALPGSTKKSLTSWKKSVNEWAKEKKIATSTPESRLKLAESLITRAQKRQEFPLDHTQDILYFRGSSILHDLLAEHTQSDALTAHALYLAGLASEATRDMSFWTLHETYYEMCIRAQPHTKQAEQCYDRLKDSVVLGYSGSGGVRIPPEVAKRLEHYQSEARKETPKKETAPNKSPEPNSTEENSAQ